MLALLKQWLQMPVEESDGRGGQRRSNPARREQRGTPQGAPISPLLSNLYMRRFVLGGKILGHAERLQARIVNYADDFVILCRDTGEQASETMRGMMQVLKLTVNEEKTRLCRVPEESCEFLGYSFERCYAAGTGRAYLGTKPQSEEASRSHPENQPVDGTESSVRRSDRWGRRAQRSAARRGPILLSWLRQQSIPGGGRACAASVAPVVMS